MAKRIVVLFSGGWESTLCVIRARQHHPHTPLYLIYFNYGAAFQCEERMAAARLSDEMRFQYHTHFRVEDIKSLPQRNGVFSARNIRMLLNAVDNFSPTHLYIGARAPTAGWDRFGDSNRCVLRAVGRSLDTKVLTLPPYPKWFVKTLVPAHLHRFIYSTEDNNHGNS